MSIRFAGALPTPLVLLLAVAVGLVAALLYRRELGELRPALRRALPLLRATALGSTVLLLLEPLLVVESAVLHRGLVRVMVDRSSSLSRRDPQMTSSRRGKLLERLDPGSSRLSPSDPGYRRAVAALDDLDRWRRAERLLLEPESGLLPRLRWPHEVELVTLGEGVEPVPLPPVRAAGEARRGLPASLPGEPDGPFTDLRAPLEAVADEGEESAPAAVVLLGDGRHNRGGDPVASARRLGARGIPVHVVGIGSSAEPVDLAVVDVRVPPLLPAEDVARGIAILKVRVPVRTRFRISVHPWVAGDRGPGSEPPEELWGRELTVPGGEEVRLLEESFEVPADSLVPGRSELVFRMSPLAGEVTTTNNARPFLVTSRKRTLAILLIDGRPRWETRYLKNLFQRDPRVSVDVVLGGVDPDRRELRRGEESEALPGSEEAFGKYGLVILGDLSRELLRDDELRWMTDLVERRGGSLVLLAGRDGHLVEYVDSPLGALLPVEFPSDLRPPWKEGEPIRLRLTAAGRAVSALRFTGDEEDSAAMWELLRPPTRVQPARALPGTETWVETREGAIPAVVHRPYGLGRVISIGFDETWRWRFRAGDRYHQRFWRQLVDILRPEVFAAEGRLLAIDTDAATYRPGDAASVRVLIRDPRRLPRQGLRVFADLLEGATRRHRVPLDEVPGSGGLYRGRTPPLQAERHVVRARVEGPGVEEEGPEVPIRVERGFPVEELHASWDEDLLRRIAEASGGEYLREEDIDRLLSLLSPLSREELRAEERSLARSPWWFLLICLLFTTEWILRKRGGLL